MTYGNKRGGGGRRAAGALALAMLLAAPAWNALGQDAQDAAALSATQDAATPATAATPRTANPLQEIDGGGDGARALAGDGSRSSAPMLTAQLTLHAGEAAVRRVPQALRRVAYDIGYKTELIGVLEAEVAALREGRVTDADQLRRARESAGGSGAGGPDAVPTADPAPAAHEPPAADGDPTPAAAETVPGGKSIACSSPAAIAWDASFATAADPSGVASSARNRFVGLVTDLKVDGVSYSATGGHIDDMAAENITARSNPMTP